MSKAIYFSLNSNNDADKEVCELMVEYASLRDSDLGFTTCIKRLLKRILPREIAQLRSVCQEKKCDGDKSQQAGSAA